MYDIEAHLMAKQVERELSVRQHARLAQLGALEMEPSPVARLRGWLARRSTRPTEETASPAVRTRAAAGQR